MLNEKKNYVSLMAVYERHDANYPNFSYHNRLSRGHLESIKIETIGTNYEKYMTD
jgi:hypothetical protein